MRRKATKEEALKAIEIIKSTIEMDLNFNIECPDSRSEHNNAMYREFIEYLDATERHYNWTGDNPLNNYGYTSKD